MSTCGSPAVPRTSASASDRKFSLLVAFAPYCLPGSMSASPPSPNRSMAPWNSSERLNPNFASTQTVITAAPAMSRIALMIWTQVVPFIPPTRT